MNNIVSKYSQTNKAKLRVNQIHKFLNKNLDNLIKCILFKEINSINL